MYKPFTGISARECMQLFVLTVSFMFYYKMLMEMEETMQRYMSLLACLERSLWEMMPDKLQIANHSLSD
jgi:hypothetical protein